MTQPQFAQYCCKRQDQPLKRARGIETALIVAVPGKQIGFSHRLDTTGLDTDC